MTIGFLGNLYEKEKSELEELYGKYIGKDLEIAVRGMGLVKGNPESILEGHFVIPDKEGKTLPTLVRLSDISVINEPSSRDWVNLLISLASNPLNTGFFAKKTDNEKSFGVLSNWL